MEYGPTTAQRQLVKRLLLEREVNNMWLLRTAEDPALTKQMMSQVISRLLECPARRG
jgi:hypothetical protein